MIKRIVYNKTNGFGYRPCANGLSQGKNDLATLFETFDLHHDWMQVDKGPDEVIIWNTWDREDYPTEDHIPKLIMTRKSYNDIVEVWNLNIDNPKKYLVLMQNEDGLIMLEAKNELSEQDLQAIEEDVQAGQEWEENWKKRYDDHWVKKTWRNLKYKLGRLWLGFRQWLQV